MRVVYNVMLFLCLLNISFLHGMESEFDGNNSELTLALEAFQQLTLPNDVTSLCFDPRTITLAYAYNESAKKNVMHFVNMESLKTINTIESSKPIIYSCFNNTSAHIGIIPENGEVFVGDWQTKKLVEPVSHGNSFVSLAFTHDNCFAVTKTGTLFCLDGKEFKEVCVSPDSRDSNSYSSTVVSMSSCEQNNSVSLVGYVKSEKGLTSFMNVITVNNDTIGYVREYEKSPLTKSCFYRDSLIALVNGKKVIVINLKNKREWTKYFDYTFDVTALCFDHMGTALFVGLEDGSVYHSELENAAGRDKPESYSTFLYYLSNPIKLLSCAKEKQMLCAATLYEVTLFNIAFNYVADNDYGDDGSYETV